MSDVAATKPEETPVASPTTAPESQPATEAAPAETKAEETPAAATETPAATETKEESKEDKAKVEAIPASEGFLGYKHRPFPNTLIWSKRFFWFGEEPAKAEHLSNYLRETKAEVAHPHAAWAQHTGKGLLFFGKRAEDKTAPSGIINLSEVTDVVKEGFKEFSFKVKGEKHLFQPENSQQQASWIVALKEKIEEAKGLKESVTGSDSYKSSLEKYSKPAAAAGVGAGAAAATAASKDKEGANTSGDEKGRSQSRKRGSIFGGLRGKKEEEKEKKETKKEEKAEDKAADKPAETSEAKTEPSAAAETAAAVPAAEAAAPTETTADKTEETPAADAAKETKETPAEKTDTKKKRSSVFGNFFQKVTSPTTEKSEKDVVPDVPAKDTTVSDTAPKVDTPVEQQPIDTAAVTAPVDNAAETPAVETKDTKDTKETKEATPAKESKLKGLFKKAEAKVDPKKETKEEDKADKKTEEAAGATTETPATTEATPAATETSGETTPKEKRRTSIFGSLSGTIKKRAQQATKSGKAPADDKKETAAETETKPEPISKDEPKEKLTNGTEKETAADVPSAPTAEAPQAAPAVSATA